MYQNSHSIRTAFIQYVPKLSACEWIFPYKGDESVLLVVMQLDKSSYTHGDTAQITIVAKNSGKQPFKITLFSTCTLMWEIGGMGSGYRFHSGCRQAPTDYELEAGATDTALFVWDLKGPNGNFLPPGTYAFHGYVGECHEIEGDTVSVRIYMP